MNVFRQTRIKKNRGGQEIKNKIYGDEIG